MIVSEVATSFFNLYASIAIIWDIPISIELRESGNQTLKSKWKTNSQPDNEHGRFISLPLLKSYDEPTSFLSYMQIWAFKNDFCPPFFYSSFLKVWIYIHKEWGLPLYLYSIYKIMVVLGIGIAGLSCSLRAAASPHPLITLFFTF